MAAVTEQDLGYRLYYKLLKTFDNNIGAVLIFDAAGALLWRSAEASSDLINSLTVRLQSQAELSNDEADSDFHRTVIENYCVDMFKIKDELQRVVLTVGIQIHTEAESQESVLQSGLVAPLNQDLLEWYFTSLKFVRQEDELNQMTEELTRRYEELNLIYKAEDQAHSVHHGREILTQLVQNTPAIIGSDLAVLVIPGRNLTIYKFKGDCPFEQSDQLISSVKNTIFKRLQATQESLVVNCEYDAIQSQLTYSLPYKFAASPLVNAEGKAIGLFALIRKQIFQDFDNSDRNLIDVLANKASKIMQYNFDPLTGLENSRSFELVLAEALKKVKANDNNGAVAYIDIDGMAIVNDLAGREGGDELIKDVGMKIASMIRAEDTVARLGGDKFGVYLLNCDLIRAQSVMRKIADQVSKIKFEWDNKLHEVSISVGIAPVNLSSKSTASLISMAESTLQVGKKKGPDRITVYKIDGGDLNELESQVQCLGRIQAALKDDGYILYSQIIVPANSDSIKPHHEILLRMRGDDNEIISPADFMPVAEKFQLMPRIDRWVISNTVQMLGEFLQGSEQLDFPVSINLSGQSLSDPEELCNFIESCFRQYRVEPASICFEVTETSAIANLQAAQEFIGKIRSLGCRFSLDDFGTGLSSFAYLKNLDVDYLKIDGSFVHNILTDKVSESMVAAINQVGHIMGLATVAEFVETIEIRNKLADIGVDFVQGYGIGEPVEFKQQLQKLRQASLAGVAR